MIVGVLLGFALCLFLVVKFIAWGIAPRKGEDLSPAERASALREHEMLKTIFRERFGREPDLYSSEWSRFIRGSDWPGDGALTDQHRLPPSTETLAGPDPVLPQLNLPTPRAWLCECGSVNVDRDGCSRCNAQKP
jgi:hypothetical protein